MKLGELTREFRAENNDSLCPGILLKPRFIRRGL